MNAPEPVDNALLERLRTGGEQAVAEELAQHRDRLVRMLQLRLDARLAGRVDAEDILQEAYLAATQRIRHYLAQPVTSFFVWLRQIVIQTLIDVHRRHLSTQRRDAGRERAVPLTAGPGATSLSLAQFFVGHLTSPSQAAIRAELAEQLERALNELKPIDREVLILRHFEDLTNNEVAEVLGIQAKAASIRYVRAIARLKDVLTKIPGFLP